jgi:hypothetical protein
MPGATWDLANALRHEGLCKVRFHLDDGLALYRRAFNIYDGMHDPRGRAGRAQTILSMGQSGRPVAVVLPFVIEAAREFRELGAKHSLNETIPEIDKDEPDLPRSKGFRALRREARIELLKAAQGCYHESLIGEEVDLSVRCIQIDASLGDLNSIAEDIEMILVDRKGYPVNAVAGTEMGGYYDSLCRKLGRAPNRRVRDQTASLVQPYDNGRRLSLGGLVAVANVLKKPNP